MAAELLGIGVRAVQRHCGALRRADLVYAVPYYPEDKERGAAPYAYGLTDSGVRDAFAQGYATDSTKSFRGHSTKTVEHELAISNFHLELARLADDNGFDLRWKQRDISPFRKKHPKDRAHDRASINPDALFAINGHFFFLEAERARLGNYRNGEPQVLRKLAAYRDYRDSTDCERDFGFRRFTVLTMMRTPDRAANLMYRLAGAGGDHKTFLVSDEAHPLNALHTFCGSLGTSRLSVRPPASL